MRPFPLALFALTAFLWSAPAIAQLPSSGAVEATLVGSWEGEMETSPWPQVITVAVPASHADTAALLTLGQTFNASEFRVQGTSVSMIIGDPADELAITARLVEGRLIGALSVGADRYPFALRRVPDYPAPRDRVEGWRQDIDILATRFLDFDRTFSSAERTLFLTALADTRDQIAELHDDEITVRLASAIALAGNPHTRLYLLRNRTELRRMPYRVWWFTDGLYVIRATSEYAHLLGCRIDAIEGVAARAARDLVAPLFAGTSSWVDYKSAYSLTSPEVLHGTGIVESPESFTLAVAGCASGADRTVTVAPLPLVRSDQSVEAWWDLSPAHPGDGWLHALPEEQPLPLYLRRPTRDYWFEYLPETDLLYFQYNRSRDSPELSTSEFGEQLLAELERTRPKAIVVDVRFNTGGNFNLGAELMKTLHQRTEGMSRYIITGRSTFSAAIHPVASWREEGGVTIVGEPVGDDLDFWAEGGNVRLPFSGFDAHFANGAHSYSLEPCPTGAPCYDMASPSISPDLPASASWLEYQAGRDPAMEMIQKLIGG